MTMRSHIQRPDSWHAEKSMCAECGRKRSSGNHAKCSKARQDRFADANQMEEIPRRSWYVVSSMMLDTASNKEKAPI